LAKMGITDAVDEPATDAPAEAVALKA